jgi:hypothetical protein
MISRLKKTYREQREKLGATGQGLVEDDREAEIESGSKIENIWGTFLSFDVLFFVHLRGLDLIQQKFPWYKRLHALMGSSPVIDRAAVSHSGTKVDLAILDGKPKVCLKNARTSFSFKIWCIQKSSKKIVVDSDDDNDSSSVAISGWDQSDEEDEAVSIASSPLRPSAPKTPKAPVLATKSETPATSTSRATKRKTAHDQIQELASQDRSQRLKIAAIREREKTARSNTKYEQKTALEMARLQHQQQEAERQRQHEFAMMQHQLQLQQMRQGGAPPFGPPGGPAFGAPPPAPVYDPNLF